MKKIVLLAALMSASYGAAAAPIAGEVTREACPLLAENVRLSLSNNILGSYNCLEDEDKGIYVATCSTAGRTAPRTMPGPCDDDDDTAIPACNADGVGPDIEYRGAFIYRASSNGGRVTPSDENTEPCTVASVEAGAAPL
ncbi:MAG: hypothetical protein ITG07_10970 [Candidimonas sp.]|nr:hypothetical protein [Candidimonas sp.]